jgi:2-polyprenyl-3-methyl-5-hydroxy-6-metoxy-1,4-benzoquinol methylase
MAAIMDPENFEGEALSHFSGGFAEASVLEVGCGNGRLTWVIADQARRVVGIDPSEEKIARARENIPTEMASRVTFRGEGLEDYAAGLPEGEQFDRALLSWSL